LFLIFDKFNGEIKVQGSGLKGRRARLEGWNAIKLGSEKDRRCEVEKVGR
jgi:hypothetical protein